MRDKPVGSVPQPHVLVQAGFASRVSSLIPLKAGRPRTGLCARNRRPVERRSPRIGRRRRVICSPTLVARFLGLRLSLPSFAAARRTFAASEADLCGSAADLCATEQTFAAVPGALCHDSDLCGTSPDLCGSNSLPGDGVWSLVFQHKAPDLSTKLRSLARRLQISPRPLQFPPQG